MTDIEQLDEKFRNSFFALSEENILVLDKQDDGSINNVIARIEPHCYGIMIFEERNGIVIKMFYVNNDRELKGDILCLILNDPDNYLLLLRFCKILSHDYNDLDFIDAFNAFQSTLRKGLEQYGYFTVTSQELKEYEGKSFSMIAPGKKGIVKIDLIDRVDYYRAFFKDNYKTPIVAGKDYVYLMVDNNNALIKIGTSKQPSYREKTLQSEKPDIHVIALWCCNKKLEKELHKKFHSKNERGEWFRLKHSELMEIEKFMNDQAGE